ncbi:MAG TPA: PHB depolymerase family esterase [Rudaea sp.]|nr:PHB depolymerase family esterase [Rudaea sp.]
MPTGAIDRSVQFDRYSPLSSSGELLRRLMTPLTALRIERALAQSGRAAQEQAVDLAREKFAVYVPTQQPAAGYGVLVFVPPWEDAVVPPQWTAALDRHGIIFVSAANSGNAANVLDRREPLALLAAYNVMQRYRVDAAHVYVGGFSGGSRVALRLALGYPDVFRGALLEAGSDPIGTAQVPLPPADLFSEFENRSRIVFLTGRNDREHIDQDERTRRSLEASCVLDSAIEPMPWTGHETADPAAIDRALGALTTPVVHDAIKLDACRKRLEDELAEHAREVEALVTAGKRDGARDALEKLDARFGGLAAAESNSLANKIQAR